MPFADRTTPNPAKRKLVAVNLGNDPFGPFEDLHVEYRHAAANENPEIRSLRDARQQCNAAYRLLQSGFLTATFDQAVIRENNLLLRSSYVTLGIPRADIQKWPERLHVANDILEHSIGPGKNAFQPIFYMSGRIA